MIGDRVRQLRETLGLSQSDVARLAGISRQGLFAIEQGRMPRADTAVRLAHVLGVSTEELLAEPHVFRWAGPPMTRARWAVVDQLTLYPSDSLAADVTIADQKLSPLPEARPPERVVVVAGCDPALPLVADWFQRLNPGWWCDVLMVPSHQALDLLAQGLVHVAGIHLYHPHGYNQPYTRHLPLPPVVGIRAAGWEEGIAARSVDDLEHWREHWQNGGFALRQSGSEARALAERQAEAEGLGPAGFRGTPLSSHLESAACVADGRARVAVMTAVVAALHQLPFIPWAYEPFDWVLPEHPRPGVERLVSTLIQPPTRHSLARLPGYDVTATGQTVWRNANES